MIERWDKKGVPMYCHPMNSIQRVLLGRVLACAVILALLAASFPAQGVKAVAPTSDLELSWVSGARHAKACQTFDVTYRVRNLGPDTAEHVMLGMGLTDQFDMVSLNGVPSGTGAMVPDVTLAPGESVLVSGQVKVTAFVPQESREGLVTAHVWSEVYPGIAIDPNEENNYNFRLVRLISKPAESCL
jgi:uncharacterized protein DUF11